MKQNEKVIIFSAPSGAGKTTIVKHLLSTNNRLVFSVSACTRQKRESEKDREDYHFLSVEDFKKKIELNEFVEWEEVYEGSFYGTLKSEITRIWKSNKAILFDADVEGGLSLKKYFGDKALAVFVKAPSLHELERRLRNRKTETEKSLKVRLSKAMREMEYEKSFDVVLVNDTPEESCREANQIVNRFLE